GKQEDGSGTELEGDDTHGARTAAAAAVGSKHGKRTTCRPIRGNASTLTESATRRRSRRGRCMEPMASSSCRIPRGERSTPTTPALLAARLGTTRMRLPARSRFSLLLLPYLRMMDISI
ncbi:unnamed protein product, partial [Nesidiocoris tenuis]